MTAPDRHLERIAALLAKAESTEHEHEHDAYVAAAQKIATRYSIELATARLREPMRARSLVVDAFDFGEQNRNLRKHLVRLMSAIARANDVRMDIRGDSSGVILYGHDTDVVVCKAMWASLSLQMVGAARAWMATGEWRSQVMWREDRYGRVEEVPMDARVARRSFYEGYVHRLAERLDEARDGAEADAVRADRDARGASARDAGPGTELVLAHKREQVADFYSAHSRASGRWSPPAGSALGVEATSAGRTAASRARLGTHHELGGGRSALTA